MIGNSRVNTPDRQQSKMLIISPNKDQKLLETEFSIAICRPTGDKWQSKTLFLAIFDLCSSSVFDCCLSDVVNLRNNIPSTRSLTSIPFYVVRETGN